MRLTLKVRPQENKTRPGGGRALRGPPFREGNAKPGKGGYSGSTAESGGATAAGQRRTSLAYHNIGASVTGFPHCAPRVRASGAPLPLFGY